MQLKPNTLLQGGKYKILHTLGQGGFGITYLAEQMALHRKVAIKEFFMKDCCERNEATGCLTVGTGSQRQLVEKFRMKFVREAQMISQLDHPNIVKIIDIFEENGTAYYVMEYINGGSLKELVAKRGALDEPTALKYIREVGDALQYVHGKAILHFDIKPSNIMLRESGTAALIDFGVSKHYDDGGNVTSSTPVGISKGYAPMEQYRMEEISTFTPATDIYALGATLYTLLTGEVPPSAPDVYDDGLPALPDHISQATRDAVTQAMTPRRKDRLQHVSDFLQLLGQDKTRSKKSVSGHSLPKQEIKEETVLERGTKTESDPTDPLKPRKPFPWKLAVSLLVALLLTSLIIGLCSRRTTYYYDYEEPAYEWDDTVMEAVEPVENWMNAPISE